MSDDERTGSDSGPGDQASPQDDADAQVPQASADATAADKPTPPRHRRKQQGWHFGPWGGWKPTKR